MLHHETMTELVDAPQPPSVLSQDTAVQTDFIENADSEITSHFTDHSLYNSDEERNSDHEQSESGREHVASIVNSWCHRESELEHLDEVEGEYTHEPAYSKMLAPSDIDNSAVVDFAGEQFMQRLDELATTTIVHIDQFLRYKREQEPRQKWHTDSLKKWVMDTLKPLNASWNNTKVRVYGPHKLHLMVDGNNIIVMGGITFDERLRDSIVLGRNTQIRAGFSINKIDEDGNLIFDLNSNSTIQGTFELDDGRRLQHSILFDTGN